MTDVNLSHVKGDGLVPLVPLDSKRFSCALGIRYQLGAFLAR